MRGHIILWHNVIHWIIALSYDKYIIHWRGLQHYFLSNFVGGYYIYIEKSAQGLQHYFLSNFVGGYYMYIETSAPRRNGDTARLISPRQQGQATPRCLRFWYHMYGAHVNALNVYVMSGSRLGTAVWTRKGTQGNHWFQASVNLNRTSSFNVSPLDKPHFFPTKLCQYFPISPGKHIVLGVFICSFSLKQFK